MAYKSILLFGAPGSGKGTQGKILGTIPGFYHCACGDVFRAVDAHSELGKAFIQYSSKGQLVPDDLTVRLWAAQIEAMEDAGIFRPATDYLVLDGIPPQPEPGEDPYRQSRRPPGAPPRLRRQEQGL